MLSHLHIRNFAIIPSLELDFESGFTAITGETGAGKSILVDALGLLLGARSDSGWVRQGEDKADLTAEFMLEANPAADAWLKEAGLDMEGQCLLRRSIAAGGRSRAWINGTPVTLQQLNELGNLLVEIHGQNEHVRLTRASQQFALLDGSGDYHRQVLAVNEAHGEWKALRDEFDSLEEQAGISPAELEYLAFQLQELRSHAISADSLRKLEQEHRKLAQGGALVEALNAGSEALENEGHGSQAGIQAALQQLEPYRELDTAIDEASRMLSEAAINCQEASQGIRQALDRIDLSPDRLAEVSGQLSTLADLGRKHQVPMEELERVRDVLAERLDRAENFESERAEMESRCASSLQAYRETAAKLSQSRRKRARSLAADVSKLMAELGMPGGVLEISIDHDPGSQPTPRGDDRIDLRVSANPGFEPGPLSKVASGGELSRISLAIKVAAGSGRTVGTQVFDEVDAGIGGETANAVGRLLASLAAGSQALCVTHLAQVAVCADHQVQVSKQADESTTAVDTALLKEGDRVDEIARMLGGKISEQSRRHASELLSAALDS